MQQPPPNPQQPYYQPPASQTLMPPYQHRNRFDWTDYAIFAFVGIVSGIGGILIGTFLIGPQWYVSHNCLAYPFLLLDPHQYIACKIP